MAKEEDRVEDLAPAQVAQSPGGGPQDAPEDDGRKEGPPGRRFRAPHLPLPGRLEREGKPCPTTDWTAAGRPHRPPLRPQSGSGAARTGPGPSTSEASAAPAVCAPTPYSPLARLRAFSGLWKYAGILTAGSAHPASVNSLVALAGRGDEGEPARGSTRLTSRRPRPASQRWKGGSHVTSARRRRRHPGPGCRGRPSACAPPFSRAQARWLYARWLTWRRLASSTRFGASL